MTWTPTTKPSPNLTDLAYLLTDAGDRILVGEFEDQELILSETVSHWRSDTKPDGSWTSGTKPSTNWNKITK
jgi:hypothetical protein